MNFTTTCNRRGRELFGAVIVLAASPLMAAPALATPGDDAHVVVKSAEAVANGPASALVACPSGERAIGGGAGFVAAYTDTVITLTTPVDETGDLREVDDGDIPRSWYTRVVNGLNESVRFTFYAICSASSDAVLASEPFTTNQANSPTYAVAPCPTGQRAIGGGVTNVTSLSSVMHTNGPLDETGQAVNTEDGDVARSWIGSAESTTNTLQNYRVLAVCSTASAATIQTDTVPIGAGVDRFLQRSTVCPTGQRALSGGFASTGSVAARLAISAPVDRNGGFNVLADGEAAGGWMVDAENFSGIAQTYKVVAICEAPTPATPDPGPGGTPDPDPDPTNPTGNPPLCAETAATIVGTEAAETIQGTPGDDVIVALGGADKVLASGGNDVVCGGWGNDTMKGGGGTDLLFGEAGRDRARGGPGRDSCYGGRGADSTSCEKGRA